MQSDNLVVENWRAGICYSQVLQGQVLEKSLMLSNRIEAYQIVVYRGIELSVGEFC